MNEQPTYTPPTEPIKSNSKVPKILKTLGIVLLVIIALGGVGYSVYAWQQNNSLTSDLKQKDSDNKRLADENEELKKAESQSTAENDEGFLVIDDWNVKFELTGALKTTEVKYYARTTSDTPSQSYYAFTTARIRDLGGKCNEQTYGDTVLLYRYSEKPEATPDGELINQNALGGYYYVVTSPIASCSGFDANDQMKTPSPTEVSDRAALKDSIGRLVAAQ
jgi:hypothetical protein